MAGKSWLGVAWCGKARQIKMPGLFQTPRLCRSSRASYIGRYPRKSPPLGEEQEHDPRKNSSLTVPILPLSNLPPSPLCASRASTPVNQQPASHLFTCAMERRAAGALNEPNEENVL